MGINTLSNISSQEIQVVANTTITSGNLVTLSDGGNTGITSSALTLAQQNVTTAGLSAISAYAQRGGANYQFFPYDNNNAVQLGNGVIAMAYSGNGSQTTTAVNVAYFTIAGGSFQPITTVSSFTNILSIKIIKLSATKFVVGYNANNICYVRVINNDGTTASSEINVATIVTIVNNAQTFNLARISDTEFIVAYSKSGTQYTSCFKRFNDSGVLQGTEVVIDSTPGGLYNILVHSSTNEIWIGYHGNNQQKFARFNSAGVLQGAIVIVLNGVSYLANNWSINGTQLSNGNVLYFANNGSGLPNMYTYTSAGVLITSNTTWHNNSSANSITNTIPAVSVNSDGTFLMTIMNGSGYVRIYKFNNSINNIFTLIPTDSFQINAGSGPGFINLFQLGSAGYALFVGGYNGSSFYCQIAALNSAGTLVGSIINFVSAQGSVYGGTAFLTAENIFFGCVGGTTNAVNAGFYNPGRKSIIGVAQNTVSSGQISRVATLGTYTINNAPSSPGVFDNRTATPAGPRGIIAGNTAILNGTT